MDTQLDSTYSRNDELRLLLSVLPIFIEAADNLAACEPTIEGRSPFLYMHALCLLVLQELDRVKLHFESGTECVAQLLALLDGLAHWPLAMHQESDTRTSDPASHQKHQRLKTLESRWVAHRQFRQSRQSQHRSFKSIASSLDFGDARHASEVLQQLQTVYEFCRIRYQEESHMYVDEYTAPRRRRVEPAWEIRQAAQSTYQQLAAIKKCACDPSHLSDARLFLATHRHLDTHEHSSSMEIFLSVGAAWQEVRIGILGEGPSIIKVSFNDKPAVKPVRNTKHTQIRSLCKLISQFRRRFSRLHRLSLFVESGSLWNNTPEMSDFPEHVSDQAISLEQFITTRANILTEKTKRIIAVMLGHGVLHLHGTRWLQQSWGASNVIFHQIGSAIPIRPYLLVELADETFQRTDDEVNDEHEPEDDDDDEDYFGSDDCFTHPFPGLVTLGMMLMQIYMGRTFESFVLEFSMDNVQLNNNTKFALASQAFKKHASAISFSDQYWSAINRCLDPNIQLDEEGQTVDQEALRRIIYDEIVGPLEDELGQGKFATDTGDFIRNLDTEARNLDLANWGQPLHFTSYQSDNMVPPLPAGPTLTLTVRQPGRREQDIKHDKFACVRVQRRPLSYSSKPMWLCKPSMSDFFDDKSRQEDVSKQARDDFTNWKEDVLEVYEEFLTSTTQATKIAVLDTGLDFEHPDFVYNPDRRKQVKERKDFTSNQNPATESTQIAFDEAGHGTHIAGILLDLAPNCDLYIAKIAEQDPSPNAFIAKAITHAVNEWKVDIITMSFGFTTRDTRDYNLVEKALQYANSKNILLFAAASNDGANQGRTFPARHDYVICIHSTAADGIPSRFNPPHEGSNNFATIGEAVESAWPRHLCDKEVNESCIAWKSGTSFATPIAAGIATFLIQYAEANLDADTVELIRKPQGMRAVFKLISREKDGYDYIAPKIHPDHLFGLGKEAREHTKLRILNVLRSS